MDYLQQLKALLGNRIKLVETAPLPAETGSFSHGNEAFFPLRDGKWLVVDSASLAPETIGVLRLLLEKPMLPSANAQAGWFARFIGDEWERPADLVAALEHPEQTIDLPARLAVIECRGEGREQVPMVLHETLAASLAVAVAADQLGRCWLYLPESAESLHAWKESAASWMDTLLTELYLEARIGISGPAMAVDQLPRARQQAEIAISAGSAYHSKRVVHPFEELGIAHILHGVSKEAKAAFLNEILPYAIETGLPQDLRETVFAFAKHALNISETARALFIHRNTLLYRLDKILETTGRDIRQFEDLLALWMALILQSEQHAQ